MLASLKRIIILLVVLGAAPGHAGQTLIPTPYPGAVGGNAQVLDPEPGRMGGPQELKADPYPGALGENAQGNPPITRQRRHQRRIPSLNERKYRVDRP